MSSNFEFCNKYWNDLYTLGLLAEKYLYTDPNACIIKIGMMSESMILKIFDYEKITKPEDTTALSLTKILIAEGLLPKNVSDSLYIIRKARNGAVHSNLGTVEDAEKYLKIIFSLCNWFMTVYGDWKYEPKEFVLPEKEENIEEIQTLEEQVSTEGEEPVQTVSSEIETEKRIAIGEDASNKMVQLDKEDQELVDNEKIRLEATVVPMINYAMTQNNIKIIPSVYIKNNTNNVMEDVVIKVESTPNFIVPFTQNISFIRENEEISVTNLNLHINMDYLVNLTEKVDGNLTIKVLIEDIELNSEIYDISLLAYDQWNGEFIYPEMLCAFVTPNHPLIGKLTSEATEILGKWTGNPSMDAYQSGDKNRVRLQAAAIYGSIQKLNIAYSECPASFGVGQRIKMCETIYQQKIGNCIEMSLLYAACLEAVGINPLIIIKKGHAYLGYWLKDTTLTDVVSDDESVITKRIADGVNDIRVVECTAMCFGNNTSYEKAEKLGERNLNETDFHLVIDVKCARLNNIVPVSSRIITDNGWTVERKELKDNEITEAPELISSLYDDEEITTNKKEYTKQEQWERKLLDLGLRNHLINLHLNNSVLPLLCTSISELENKLADKEKFRLLPKPSEFEMSENKDDFEAISDLGEFKGFIQSEFENNVIHTPFTEAFLNLTTKNLYRKARTSLEENGSNSLFLAIGLLKWCEAKKTLKSHYAPILLIPVDLVKKSSATEYTLQVRDEEPQLNISLLEKLKQDFNLTIPGLDTLPEDDSGIDVSKVLTIFRKGIMNQKYWDVLESAYIGIFSFSSFVMWNDLHSRYDDISKNKIVKSLIDQQICWDINSDEEESSNTYLPITLDSSQLSAVKEASNGKSFILHGPPGTGKSQTITALIANALGNGKKVLFVAEKRAALEVVQERLEKIGLGPFCLEMHSNKTNKTTILEHLKETEEIRKKKTSQDFEAKLAQLNKVKEELDDYAMELHKPRENGITLYEAINNYELYSTYPNLVGIRFNEPERKTYKELESDYAVIQNLIAVGKKTGHPHNHPLQRIKLDQYTPQLKEDIEKQCGDYETSIYDFFDDVDNFANKINYGEVYEYDKCLEVLDIANKLSTFKDVPTKWAQVENPERYFKELSDLCTKKLNEEALKDDILKYFKPEFLEVNVSSDFDSLTNLNEAYQAIKQNYKKNLLTTFDVLKIDSNDLIFVDDNIKEKINLIDNLISTINKLGNIKNSPLNSVQLADTSAITRQQVNVISAEFRNILMNLKVQLASLSSKLNLLNSSEDALIEITYLLKEWENIPRAFASHTDISLYLADIEKMANAAIHAKKLRESLDKKWNTQFFDLDAEELFDEYNHIETSGIFNKLLEFNSFKKKLSVYYKDNLDKNDIKNELSEYVEYQKECNTFNALFSEYGNDLKYLYTGAKTDWNYIIEFTQEVLKKAQRIDTTLKTSRIRVDYAANEELLPLINQIIESYDSAKQKRKEFNSILCINNIKEHNFIENDLAICKEIVDKQKNIKCWIEYNAILQKANELNLDEIIANVFSDTNVLYIGKEQAKSIINELKEYQNSKTETDSTLNEYRNEIEEFNGSSNINWTGIKKAAINIAKLEMQLDKETKYKEYRIKNAGDKRLNEHFLTLLKNKDKYEKEQKKFYDLLNIESNSNNDWYEEERDLCGNVMRHIDELRDWAIFNKAVEETNNAHLENVVINYVNGIEHDDLLNAYKKAYFKALSESIISKSLVLSDFSGGVFEDKVKRFKVLDEEIKKTNQTIIFNNIVSNIPDFEKEASKSKEVAILNRAIQNKGRGRSLRTLFSQLPTIITRLCPCVLMSPLSVAQYLDPESSQFDLIVFDEASQLQTCKAVGAIARAKNAVIVGDPKQMPPTSFFTTNTFDEEHEDIEDLESILDDCLAIKMPSKHLTWHYRSAHESLIAFSNSKFYENKLYTFPSFNDRESMVKYVKVKGTFDKGKKRTNRVEAEAILNELKRRCNDPILSKDSVGVVTFNSNQQDLIEDLIGEECEKNKKFYSWINREEDKSVFVKNLENIQGDERDVILFSVCYGPDANGKISMNFGPLNREGGWRRLNVAITRARKEMVVYTSMVPEQITLTKTEGVAALRGFLEFARTGRLNLDAVEANKEKYNSPGIVDSVCKELEEKGYKCAKLIGHSDYRIDIGVINPENPEQYLLGILIDGPNYQIAENTRDREVAQTLILKNLGWNIYRLWSLDWWNDKSKVILQIEQEIDRAKHPKTSEDLKNEIEENEIVIVSKEETQKKEIQSMKNIISKSLGTEKKSTIEQIKDLDVEVIENTTSSGIVWVIYDETKAQDIESILKESNLRYALERRGAIATSGRKAYRIMMRG